MNQIVKKNGILFGIFMGVFSVLITTMLYVIDLKLFMNMWLGIVTIVIYIIIGIVLITKTKKELNNFITFKEAFTAFFIAAVIGATISVAYNFILFNFIDPQAKATIQEMTIKYTVDMMEKFGAPADSVNETIAKLEGQDNYSAKNMGMGLLFSYVGNAILGLILAAIFKSRPTYKE
ncbi:MAG: DUF4199 domain-containing protein [Flavobacterium sp.]|nr:MAG: DUF4199 domain-containing protein [Flavobacterium sp.]